MRKFTVAVAGALALMGIAAPAQAAIFLEITGTSGTFGDNQVTCPTAETCAFTRAFTFLTPSGFNLASATISTAQAPGAAGATISNIDFTSVLLNNVAFTLFNSPSISEFGALNNLALTAGATNNLIVNGRNTGDGAFAGTLVFAGTPGAVPEPGTWAMMLFGFGATGIAMRRRKRPLAMQIA